MHTEVQSCAESLKPSHGISSAQKPKHSVDSECRRASFSSDHKGKKRNRSHQGIESSKREGYFPKQVDNGESMNSMLGFLKLEVAKITENGSITDAESVNKLVHMMHFERATDLNRDFAAQLMLVNIIAAMDKHDCLERFVHLRGLTILGSWLQNAYEGTNENEKVVNELILALLRALGNLPVNISALQACQVGKSVNNLRSHRNSEIRKKARGLVNVWKQRVEAEMNVAAASNQDVSWPGRAGISEVSDSGNQHTGSSETTYRSYASHVPVCKSPVAKSGPPKSVGRTNAVLSETPTVMTARKISPTVLVPPAVKEDKSSSSSQSMNNSQSCSSDHTKAIASSRKDDSRSSSGSAIATSSFVGSSCNKRISKRYLSSPSDKREASIGKHTLDRKMADEKTVDVPRLVVRFTNPVHSPARSASGVGNEDPLVRFVDRYEPNDPKEKMQNNVCSRYHSDATVESQHEVKKGPINLEAKASDDSSVISPPSILVESCLKNSEATTSSPIEDVMGLDLLASVAAKEICKSGLVPQSLCSSPGGSTVIERKSAYALSKLHSLCDVGYALSNHPSNSTLTTLSEMAEVCALSGNIPSEDQNRSSDLTLPCPSYKLFKCNSSPNDVSGYPAVNSNGDDLKAKECLDGAVVVQENTKTDTLTSSEYQGWKFPVKEGSSLAAKAELNCSVKLNFDLNEVICGDEELDQSAASTAINIPTVAAPTKGHFIPPVNALNTHSNAGWRGSAATSAFRPAEPSVVGMKQHASDIPSCVERQSCLPLDIDLNVADESVPDGESQNSNKRDYEGGPCRSDGLDFDLNKVDDSAECVQNLSNNASHGSEVPVLPQKHLFGGSLNIKTVNSGNFNLDTAVGEPSLGIKIMKETNSSSYLHNDVMKSTQSLFTQGGSHPPVVMPSLTPGRDGQHFPVLRASGTQGLAGGVPFGTESYRASVLPTSPAIMFSPTFCSYAGFPFGSFPVPSQAFSVGPVAYASSVSGRTTPGHPVIPSPFVGSVGALPSHLHKPPFAEGNGRHDMSWKCARQGFDLNSDPGGPGISGKFEIFSSNPDLVKPSQAFGTGLKGKEASDGCDRERSSNNGISWQFCH